MRDTELIANWFEDIGARLRRRVKDLNEDALVIPDDESVAKAVRCATGIIRGRFAHIGEIDALLAIRERSAQRASA